MPRNSARKTTRSIPRGERTIAALMLCAGWALSPLNAGVSAQGAPLVDAVSTTVHHEATSVRNVWLGLTVQPLVPDVAVSLGLPRAEGALVSDVDANGPAARVGLKPGDVIVAVDGRPIADEDDLLDQISFKE